MKNIRYRQASIHDIPAMSEIRTLVRENMLRNPASVTHQMYVDYLHKSGRGWVGELEGRVIGFSYADRQDHSIWALFVHPDFEGRGAGQALLNLATEWLFAQGASRVILGTAANTRADRFYRALGWERGAMRNEVEVEYALTRRNYQHDLSEPFRRAGYAVIPELVSKEQLEAIDMAVNRVLTDSVNLREMLQLEWCRDLAATLRQQLASRGVMPSGHVAIQCTYFEKSVEHNWLVALHQDLSIPVKGRVEHPSLQGWSVKHGTLFVQPPAELLESLVALRLHIDDCGVEDGALKVVPASHRSGRLAPDAMSPLRDELGETVCPVGKGGGMVMRPLLLHASSKASGDSRRRVLHFVFGPQALPYGLRWATAV